MEVLLNREKRRTSEKKIEKREKGIRGKRIKGTKERGKREEGRKRREKERKKGRKEERKETLPTTFTKPRNLPSLRHGLAKTEGIVIHSTSRVLSFHSGACCLSLATGPATPLLYIVRFLFL